MALIDGDAVIAFCRERCERMKNPLTKAIYAGLANRIQNGQFGVFGTAHEEEGETDVDRS